MRIYRVKDHGGLITKSLETGFGQSLNAYVFVSDCGMLTRLVTTTVQHKEEG